MKIILGSSSPHRKQLLREMGYPFEVVSPDIEEKAIRHPDPRQLVMALANAKADALAARLSGAALVITADQVVVQNGAVHEKPESEAQARTFLRKMGKAPLETISGLAVTRLPDGRRAAGVDIARLWIEPLPEDLIDTLIQQGEVLYCSGALRVEDPLFAPYIRQVEGTIDSIMGLPKALTRRLMDEVNG